MRRIKAGRVFYWAAWILGLLVWFVTLPAWEKRRQRGLHAHNPFRHHRW